MNLKLTQKMGIQELNFVSIPNRDFMNLKLGSKEIARLMIMTLRFNP